MNNNFKIDWSPIKKGGTNIHTHRLVSVSDSRIEIRKTGENILIYSSLAIIGLGCILFGLIHSALWIIFFGVILLITGLYAFIKPKTGVFDKHIGWFWLGSEKLTATSQIQALETKVRLSSIIAVQLVDEYIDDVDNSYHLYELNLIQKNNTRTNVMKHGHVDIDEDGYILATFLNVPFFKKQP